MLEQDDGIMLFSLPTTFRGLINSLRFRKFRDICHPGTS